MLELKLKIIDQKFTQKSNLLNHLGNKLKHVYHGIDLKLCKAMVQLPHDRW